MVTLYNRDAVVVWDGLIRLDEYGRTQSAPDLWEWIHTIVAEDDPKQRVVVAVARLTSIADAIEEQLRTQGDGKT
jgi:hypothetical protein